MPALTESGPRGHEPLAPARRVRIAGIVNLTRDSFSDGGKYLLPESAIERAHQLLGDGADVIDLGPASTRPGATPVPPDEEVRRLEPVVERLVRDGVTLSVDSFQPRTQRWAVDHGVAILNDIQGFPHPELYPALAASPCSLVVMHSVQRLGPATRVDTDSGTVLRGIDEFFAERLGALERAGVARERLIVDPGMGFFLGRDAEVSLAVLRHLEALENRFGCPVWVCVSRKHFLGQMTGRDVAERGAATLAAEIFAAANGAAYVRTHDVAALRDALLVWERLSS